jgi:hypothetical protein
VTLAELLRQVEARVTAAADDEEALALIALHKTLRDPQDRPPPQHRARVELERGDLVMQAIVEHRPRTLAELLQVLPFRLADSEREDVATLVAAFGHDAVAGNFSLGSARLQ